MSLPRKGSRPAALSLLISLLVSIVYFFALIPLARWGANAGPVTEFRLTWILVWLAYAFVQTAFKPRTDKGLAEQLAPVLKFLCIGSLLGWGAGCTMIGFDNTGFGAFLNLMVGLGLAAGLISLVAGKMNPGPK